VVKYQVKSVAQHLFEEPLSIDHVERALDNIYKVSEEHPTSRYVIRNADIVVLIVTILSKNSKTIGSRLRSKVLMTLLSIAKDKESRVRIHLLVKIIMVSLLDKVILMIHEVDKQIDKLSGLLQKLKEANEESKVVTKASAMKAIKKRMEKDIDEVGNIAHGVKTKIEAINRDDSFAGEDNHGQPSRQGDIDSVLMIHEVDKQINKLSGLLQKLKEANEESKAVTKASAMK
ncbi:hypothetical protein S245_053105, partial [Arachis hypogaea]